MWYYPFIAVATLFDGYIAEVLFIAECAEPVFWCGEFAYQKQSFVRFLALLNVLTLDELCCCPANVSHVMHVHFATNPVWIFHSLEFICCLKFLCSSRETWRTVICNHKCVLQKKWNSLDALEGNSLAGEEHPFICARAVGEAFLNSLNHTVRSQCSYNANSWCETSSFKHMVNVGTIWKLTLSNNMCSISFAV